MKEFFYIVYFCAFLFSMHVEAKTYKLPNDINRVSSILESAEGHSVFVIKDTIDLRGQTISIPSFSRLKFKRGLIKNGNIIFNDTRIVSKKTCFGAKLCFYGSIVDQVNIKWFDICYDRQCDNSSLLNSALQLSSLSKANKKILLLKNSHIYVKSHDDAFDKKNNHGIQYMRTGTVFIPSHVTFDLNGSTIECISNSKSQYNVLFSKETVGIKIINGIIRGDAQTHTYSAGSDEWGYGIELQGVQDFEIKNIVCEYCIGDGIDLQVAMEYDGSRLQWVKNCKRGRIEAVTCRNNGRNSLSIEGCDSLFIYNSSFCTATRTAPRAGIDIEPSISIGCVSSVFIENSTFSNNGSYGLLLHKIKPQVVIDNIVVRNCTFEGSDVNYHILNNGASNLLINNSQFVSATKTGYCVRGSNSENMKIDSAISAEGISVQFDGVTKGTTIENSLLLSFRLHDYDHNSSFEDVVLSNCKIKPHSGVYALMEHTNTTIRADVLFEKCIFDYSDVVFTNSLHRPFLIGNNMNHKYTFSECTLLGNGDEIVSSSNIIFRNSILKNTRVAFNMRNTRDCKIDFINNKVEELRGGSATAFTVLNLPANNECVLDVSGTEANEDIKEQLFHVKGSSAKIKNLITK